MNPRALHRFVDRELAAEPLPERCGVCGGALADDHRHVIDLADRTLQCACGSCAILFADGARFRTVPDRVLSDPTFAVTPIQLGLSAGLAFVVRSSSGARIVCYPGPAGVVESALPSGVWSALVAATWLALELRPDVEALAIHGDRGARQSDCYLVPIDMMYGLAGALRRSWRGVSGGAEAHRAIIAFFDQLSEES